MSWEGVAWVGKCLPCGKRRCCVEHSITGEGLDNVCLAVEMAVPVAQMEDVNRKLWEEGQHTGLLSWDPLWASRSSAYCAVWYSLWYHCFWRYLLYVPLVIWSGVFLVQQNLFEIGSHFDSLLRTLLIYLSGLSLVSEGKMCYPYSRCCKPGITGFLLSHCPCFGKRGWDADWMLAAVRWQVSVSVREGFSTLLTWGWCWVNITIIQVSLSIPLWYRCMSEHHSVQCFESFWGTWIIFFLFSLPWNCR